MKKILSLLLLFTCLISYSQNATTKELWKLFQSGAYDEAIKKATPLLEIEEEKTEANLLIGRCLTEKHSYKEAISFLKIPAYKDKKCTAHIKAWGLAYIGTCYFMTSKYSDAEKALKKCIKLNATKNSTQYASKRYTLFGFDKAFKKWTTFKSKHFVFHFQDIEDPIKIEAFAATREKAYKDIQKTFDTELPKRIDFFVWNSREDAKDILKRNIGFANSTYCIIHAHVNQTKGHEMTHIISNYTPGITKKTRFINEGTAVSFNQDKSNKEKLVKRWIKKNKQKVDIIAVWKKGKDYPEALLYPLGGLFVDELIAEFGKKKFLEFFTDQRYENAQLIYGNELDILIQKIEAKLNK